MSNPLRSTVFSLLLCSVVTLPALAVTSNWIGPGTDFNSASNWSAGAPSDVAAFGTAGPYLISFSQGASLNGLTYNSGGTAYTLNLNSQNLSINGAGITNNSNYSQSLVTSGGQIAFTNSATAGNATFHTILTTSNFGTVTFFNSSSAGNSSFTNNANGETVFANNSNAGNATIVNNNNGTTYFYDTSSGGSATIVLNPGGTLDISSLSSVGTTVGAIDGDGSVKLGSKILTVDASSIQGASFSGVISGLGGSLVKAGSGIFYLGGNNTYSGSTNINAGVLQLGSSGAMPFATNVNFANAAGAALDLNGYDTALGGISGGGASGGNIELGTATLTLQTPSGAGTYGGSIQGTGGVVKAGAALQVFTGSNIYSGSTQVNSGIIRAGASNTLSPYSAVIMANVSGAGLDLTSDGIASTSQVIGSLAGGGANGGNVAFGSSSPATLTTGGDNSSSTYAGVISGNGGLVKTGNGIFTLSGSNTYTGNTTLNLGVLNVTGAITQSDITVATGGNLSGTGSVRSVVNNGKVTPGVDGSGALHVFNYSGSGILDIQLNGPSNTSLISNGTVTLTGGSLNVFGNNFMRGTYTVIQGGSVDGTFSTVNLPSSQFFQFQTQYDPGDVVLIVSGPGFASVAQTGNQRTVAAALDTIDAPTNANITNVLGALNNLDASEARTAFNALSGDALASFQTSSLQNAAAFSAQMLDHGVMDGLLFAKDSRSPVQLAYNGDIANFGEVHQKQQAPKGLWARGVGLFDKTDADASIGSAGSTSKTGGFQAGYDYRLTDQTVVGLSGGYAQTSLSVTDRSSSGNSDTVQGGLYGRFTPGSWFFNLAAAYSGISNSNTRAIAFPGINETATADFKSHLYSEYAEAGYSLPFKRFLLQPSLAFRESHLQQNGYTETGAPGLDLAVAEETLNSTVSDLGFLLSQRFLDSGRHSVTLGLRTAWEHEFGTTNNLVAAQFADAPGTSFTIEGTPRPRDSAAIGLDAEATLTKNLDSFLNYSANLAANNTLQGLLGGLRLRW